MGRVFLARSPGGRKVAIKVMHANLADNPELRARFRQEVTAARTVSGAFTAPIIDADTEAAPPWLVTAYLPGLDLHEVVAAFGPLPMDSVRALGAALAEALISLHRADVVHRDLKPSNVLLCVDGPRVIDFGIARTADAASLTQTGMAVGSPGYMSPEQVTGGAVGSASDVFSYGAVLTYAATGEGPFGTGGVQELTYRVLHGAAQLDAITDPDLRGLIAMCLEKDPERRPDPQRLRRHLTTSPSATAFGTDWLPSAVAEEITERANKPKVPSTRGINRRALLIAGAAGISGGAALLLSRSRRPSGVDWVFHAEHGITNGPTAAGDTVFITTYNDKTYQEYSDENYEDQILHALNAHTGKHRWTAPSNYSYMAGGLPLAARDGIGYTVDAVGFRAFDMISGGYLWSYTTPGPGFDDTLFLIANDLAYLPQQNHSTSDPEYQLLACDVRTGEERWRFNTRYSLSSHPETADGAIYIVDGEGSVYALDAATGQPRWTTRLAPLAKEPSAGSYTTPSVADGQVYVVDGDYVVHALDTATGKLHWRSPTLRATNQNSNAPIVANNTLYIPCDNKALYALATVDGKLRWKFTNGLSSKNDLLPIFNWGLVFFLSADTFYALDAATGKPRWTYDQDIKGELDERPVIAGGAVHYSSFDALYSFEPRTGKLLRRRKSRIGGTNHLAATNGMLYWGTGVESSAADVLYALPASPPGRG